ncbi:MAG: DUF4376 domain-containing protein [Gammaproteobacteria bacterium]|nr:MAG: DUF4376 domain-containing protein [Gammaproteobacteria bacterium]
MAIKIVRRRSDHAVLFAAPVLALGDTMVTGDGWTCKNLDVTLLEILEVDGLPEFYVAGGWTYDNGAWTPNSTGNQYMLPAKRAAKIAELEAARLALEYSDITHAGQTWKTDTDARALLAQVLSPGSVRANAYWRDAAGAKHTMTYADLQALGRAISDRGYDADETLETKKAAVAAAATAEEIDSITWES